MRFKKAPDLPGQGPCHTPAPGPPPPSWVTLALEKKGTHFGGAARPPPPLPHPKCVPFGHFRRRRAICVFLFGPLLPATHFGRKPLFCVLALLAGVYSLTLRLFFLLARLRSLHATGFLRSLCACFAFCRIVVVRLEGFAFPVNTTQSNRTIRFLRFDSKPKLG